MSHNTVLGGRIILTGHKISRGMAEEVKAAKQCPHPEVINLTGLTQDQARSVLRGYVSHRGPSSGNEQGPVVLANDSAGHPDLRPGSDPSC